MNNCHIVLLKPGETLNHEESEEEIHIITNHI